MGMEEKRIRWCRTTPRDALKLLGSNGQSGLSHKEAYARLRKNGPNRFMEPPKQAYGILKSLLRDPVLLLTLLCGVLSLCFDELLSGLPFLLLLGVWSGLFLGRLLHAIGRFQSDFAFFGTPSVTVLREGEAFLIPATRVVRGDVIVLHEGDIVPCDCRLLSGDDLTVRMTWREGEKPTPHLYRKTADRIYAFGDTAQAPDFENMVYGGSEIVAGSAVALAVELGETSFLGAMGERFGKTTRTVRGEMLGGILPYCKLLSFTSLLLLFLVGIVSLFAAPSAYTSLRVFLPVCVITASASVGVTGLYFTALLFRNRRAAGAEKQKRNRVYIRTDIANETLPYLTDLVITDRSAFSDGRLHLRAGYTGDGVVTGGAPLAGLAEAFVLLAKAREALPAAQCDRFTETEDMTYLSELLRASKFDLHALDIRLSAVNLIAAGDEELLHVATATETFRLHVTHGVGAVTGCSAIQSEGGELPMTPERLERILRFCAREEDAAGSVRTVVKEKNGRFLLVGLLALGEVFLPDLNERLDKLNRAGVRVSVLLPHSREDCLRYFRNCCPDLPIEEPAALEQDNGAAIRIAAGADRDFVTEYLKKLKKSKRTAALLCNRTDNRQLLGAAALRVVCDDCFGLLCDSGEALPERIPVADLTVRDGCTQSVRNSADLILCRAGASGGGIAALEPILRRSKAMTWRLRALLWNLTLLKLARMLFFTLCALSGLGPPTAAEMLFVCFGGDLAALYVAQTGKLQHPERTPFRPDYTGLMRFFRDRRIAVCTTVPPLAIWLVSLILRVTGLLSAEAAQSLPILGLAILQVVLLTFAESDDVRMRTSAGYARLAVLLLAPLLPSVLLSVLIPTVGKVTGLGTWSLASGFMTVFAFLASLAGTLPIFRKKTK